MYRTLFPVALAMLIAVAAASCGTLVSCQDPAQPECSQGSAGLDSPDAGDGGDAGGEDDGGHGGRG